MIKRLTSGWLVAALVAAATPVGAAVEYVKICSLYGAGFNYHPGTDACVDALTGDTRVNSSGGVWRTFMTDSGAWFRSARAACRRGRLVNVGTFGPEDLTVNLHRRYETEHVPLALADDEFISSVMFHGGFDATSRSTFCLSFYDVRDLSAEPFEFYTALGCQNTYQMRDQPGTWAFAPIHTTPEADDTSPFHLVAHAADEPWGIPDTYPQTPPPDPPTFDGEITISVCVDHLPRN